MVDVLLWLAVGRVILKSDMPLLRMVSLYFTVAILTSQTTHQAIKGVTASSAVLQNHLTEVKDAILHQPVLA